MTTSTIIEIEISTPHEINSAYQRAIHEYTDDDKDVWCGIIKLTHIKFQHNFRREEYICVFEILDENKP